MDSLKRINQKRTNGNDHDIGNERRVSSENFH